MNFRYDSHVLRAKTYIQRANYTRSKTFDRHEFKRKQARNKIVVHLRINEKKKKLNEQIVKYV